MGHFYAETVAVLGTQAVLAAVVDPNANVRSVVQSKLGVEHAFAEVGAALERARLDAVIVAAPTSAHGEVVKAAAAAGKAIFCEKPLALTAAETRSVLEEVRRAGALLQIGFMRRFDEGHVRARAAIESGKIGRPLVFRSIGRDPGCPPVAFADPRHSGGLIIDMGIHEFDLARWLMSSDVERVSAEGSLLVCEELRRVGDIDNAIVSLRFASGALGSIEVSRTARYGYDIQSEVLGSDGALRVGASSARGADEVQLLPAQAPQDDPTPPFVRRFAKAYRAQIEDFFECVQHEREPRAGGEDALAAIEIAEAATVSARSGQPIRIGSAPKPDAASANRTPRSGAGS
jgi:predicted dehydrogenase